MNRFFLRTLILLWLYSAGCVSFAQQTAYADEEQRLQGWLEKPRLPNAPKAGVLILPAWMGVDAHSRNTANRLADLGYYAFVADIYGEGNYPENAQEAAAKSGYFKTHTNQYHQRIRLALEQLIKAGADPDQIVIIGYCFGGTGALEAARAGLPVKGVVSFHGGLSRDVSRTVNPVSAKVLVLHGADDPFVSQAEISAFQQEMREAKADWQMVYYSGAVHAFTEKAAGDDPSKGVAYNEKASRRSWIAMLDFLEELFS